jgi:hypothetical protein
MSGFSRGMFMNRFAVLGLAAILWTSSLNNQTVWASCYGYKGSRQERIKLEDKKNGFVRVWATQNLSRSKMVGRLRHGEVVTTLKFVEDPVCGGSVYIRFRNSKGKIAYGWVFSDVFVYLAEP